MGSPIDPESSPFPASEPGSPSENGPKGMPGYSTSKTETTSSNLPKGPHELAAQAAKKDKSASYEKLKKEFWKKEDLQIAKNMANQLEQDEKRREQLEKQLKADSGS